jgi:hypothetical protein
VPNVDLPYNANLKLTTSRYYLPSGRGIKMKEGITPDVEVKPDTLANITLYLDRLDSTEVMLDYVVDYIAKHPTIVPASVFHLTDADYQDFKQTDQKMFPTKNTITLTTPNTEVKLGMTLNYIKNETEWETRTQVSSKYREVTVDEIIRRFMSL